MPHQTNAVAGAGLAGIIAGDSAICLCGAEDETLLYCGYSIDELATHSSFEEVAWLLLHGSLPGQNQLQTYCSQLQQLRVPPSLLLQLLENIPATTHPMDVLRTACSFLGNLEPETKEHSDHAIANCLIAVMPSFLLYWWIFQQQGRRLDLKTDDSSQAGYLLHLLLGHPPTDSHRHALDVALMLYAEHEFNASTFTVRTIASTLSDFYSAICGGIGALKGPLHGGANEWAMAFLQEQSDPAAAEKAIMEMLRHKELIMGFGHRVYKKGDPRSVIIKQFAKHLAEETQQAGLFHIAERIEAVMWREKQLCPNLDFYSAVLFHCLEIPTALFTPLFAVARITGWSAHLLEQRAHNKLIRPLSHYIGERHRSYVPLAERSQGQV